MAKLSSDLGVLQHRGAFRNPLTSSPDMIWSSTLNCWCVFNSAEIIEIFKNRDFRVTDYRGELTKIAKRIDLDFSASTIALSYVPLAHEDEEHRASRRNIATHLSRMRAGALARFEKEVGSRVGIFSTPTVNINLTDKFFSPIVDGFIETLSGVSCPFASAGVGPSQIFDRALGINRRKAINQQLEEMQSKQVADTDPAVHHSGIALNILGRDALLGTLQESFLEVLRRNPDRSLDAIEWPARFIKTGVPYVERRAESDVELRGQNIRRGDRIRLYVDADNSPALEQALIYFGGARHKCLGEAISNKAWLILTAYLGSLTAKLRVLNVVYKQHDFVFNCPIEMNVDVYSRY